MIYYTVSQLKVNFIFLFVYIVETAHLFFSGGRRGVRTVRCTNCSGRHVFACSGGI